MGENKEDEKEQTGQGGPNPWIYDVSKDHDSPPFYPGEGLFEEMDEYFAKPPQQKWIVLIILIIVLVVLCGIVAYLLITGHL